MRRCSVSALSSEMAWSSAVISDSLVASFRDSAALHLGPILINDCIDVGARLCHELRALLFGQAFGQAVDVPQGVGFEVYIEVRSDEVRPYGVEHEAENDGVGRADDIELPADQVVMHLTLFAWPDAVQCCHKEHRAGHREDEDENVLG